MRITVFTPAYNRGYIIENLFRSLQRQTFEDFEWIIIDDGSTDDTQTRIEQFQAEPNKFSIRYFKVENGGKHRAINLGVQKASGELFFIVDSDDYLTDDALASISAYECTIPAEEKSNYAGVCGQRGYSSQIAIGKTFVGETLDITTLERPVYGITGDKSEVFYTDILKKYPFPEINGEKFITECVVWDKIAADGYKLRFFNRIVMICNYLSDGLTAQGNALFCKNPKGWGLYIAQSVEYGKISGFDRWKSYLDYFYGTRGHLSFRSMAEQLQMNPVRLWIRLFGMRVFYKLYSR